MTNQRIKHFGRRKVTNIKKKATMVGLNPRLTMELTMHRAQGNDGA